MSDYSTTEPGGAWRPPARLVYVWRWNGYRGDREGLLLTPCDTTALWLLTRTPGRYPGQYGRRWIRAHDSRTVATGSAPAPPR